MKSHIIIITNNGGGKLKQSTLIFISTRAHAREREKERERERERGGEREVLVIAGKLRI